jgi:hypothetical protein
MKHVFIKAHQGRLALPYIFLAEKKKCMTHDISLRYIFDDMTRIGYLIIQVLARHWSFTYMSSRCLAIKCSWLGRSRRTNSCIYKSNTPSRTCTQGSRVQYRRCCNSWNQSPSTTTCSRSHSCCRASVLPPDLAKKTGRAWCKCWR